MRARCRRPTHPSFKYYGARGIEVCSRWNSYPAFLADMGERPAGMSIDRINNDGNYEPGNCRWASHLTQAKNSRQAHHILRDGKTQTLKDWSKELGFSYAVACQRVMSGMTPEQALDSAMLARRNKSRVSP